MEKDLKKIFTPFDLAVGQARLQRAICLKIRPEKLLKCDVKLQNFIRNNLVDYPFFFGNVRRLSEVYRLCGDEERYEFYRFDFDIKDYIWCPVLKRINGRLRITFIKLNCYDRCY